MGTAKQPEKVKLFTAILTCDLTILPPVYTILQDGLGPICLLSPVMDFHYTRYYEPEMGINLKRQFLGFEKPVMPDDLVEIKLNTNQIEKEFSTNEKRTVNLDPGYLAPAKVVLVTTKDFSHRIYLGKGIYGEITLLFRRSRFEPLPWTYPDYRSQECHQFFQELRKQYMEHRKVK